MAVKSLEATRKKTTESYKLIWNTLRENIARLKADRAYYQSLLRNSTKSDDREAQTGIKATNAGLGQAMQAYSKYISDCNRALARRDINKFW